MEGDLVVVAQVAPVSRIILIAKRASRLLTGRRLAQCRYGLTKKMHRVKLSSLPQEGRERRAKGSRRPDKQPYPPEQPKAQLISLAAPTPKHQHASPAERAWSGKYQRDMGREVGVGRSWQRWSGREGSACGGRRGGGEVGGWAG